MDIALVAQLAPDRLASVAHRWAVAASQEGEQRVGSAVTEVTDWSISVPGPKEPG